MDNTTVTSSGRLQPSAVAFLFIGISIIAANVPILLVFCISKKVRHFKYVWYGSLAGSDFLFGIGIILSCFNNLMGNLHIISLFFTCLFLMSHNISLLSLVALSFQRLVFVMFPHNTTLLGRSKVFCLNVFIWVYSVALYGIMGILEVIGGHGKLTVRPSIYESFPKYYKVVRILVSVNYWPTTVVLICLTAVLGRKLSQLDTRVVPQMVTTSGSTEQEILTETQPQPIRLLPVPSRVITTHSLSNSGMYLKYLKDM